MDRALEELYDQADVVARRDHRDLTGVLDRALRAGQIEAVLPGVYACAHHKTFPEVRVAALRLYEPRAVLVGAAAARMSYWTQVEVDDVAAAVPRKLVSQPGYRFLRRRIPEELVHEVDGVRLTAPALTAIDLGPDAIDHALRTGAATLAEMREALTVIRWQPGNAARRLVLQESGDQPRSSAERRLHRLLGEAGIGGWRGNVALHLGAASYVVDVLFARPRLVIEVDGRHLHDQATFECDRWRQNALVLDGWRVLRFTWQMLETSPERVIETVRAALGGADGPASSEDRRPLR